MAIGINTIILIVLALIVLAVMAYLILQASSTPTLDCNVCKAKFGEFCRICWSSHCSGYEIEKEVCECLNKCGLSCNWNDANPPTCKDLNESCAAIGVSYLC